MKPMTAAQFDRQERRDPRTGKYIKNPCDLCGKGAPMTEYYSDDRVNTVGRGWGLVLHARCADKLGQLSDEEYEQLADFVHKLHAKW